MRDFKRERGFLTFAQQGDTDYLRLAYALALSLKASQRKHGHLSVVVTPGTAVPDRYRAVFDEVIDVPWLDEARHSAWKLENEWKAYHITPYRETVKLDADMLFPTDVTEWWDLLALNDIAACTRAHTFRGEAITDDRFRKTFTANRLPNIYTAFLFFRHSDLAEELFKTAEIIFHNWEKFFYEFLDETRPNHVSTDVVFALALRLMDAADDATLSLDWPRFVHLKSELQGWSDHEVGAAWSRHVPMEMTDDGVLTVGRHRQTMPVHYHDKLAMTDRIIAALERRVGV